MFFADNSEGILVEASQAAKEEEYICRGCGETVRLRAIDSKSRRVHFAHLPGSQCEWQHADMSEWHLAWQARFPEKCREVGLEKDGVKHRADVLVNNTVIEFQHSPIPLNEFHARNEFYLGCGYRLIWVFDMPDKIKRVGHGTLELKRQKDTLVGYWNKKDEYDIVLESDGQLYLLCSDASSNTRKNTFLCYKEPISKERFVQAVSRDDSSQFPRLQQRLEKSEKEEEEKKKRRELSSNEQKKESYAGIPAYRKKPVRRHFHF